MSGSGSDCGKPLFVDTVMEYSLDTRMFPDLGESWHITQPALMVAQQTDLPVTGHSTDSVGPMSSDILSFIESLNVSCTSLLLGNIVDDLLDPPVSMTESSSRSEAVYYNDPVCQPLMSESCCWNNLEFYGRTNELLSGSSDSGWSEVMATDNDPELSVLEDISFPETTSEGSEWSKLQRSDTQAELSVLDGSSFGDSLTSGVSDVDRFGLNDSIVSGAEDISFDQDVFEGWCWSEVFQTSVDKADSCLWEFR